MASGVMFTVTSIAKRFWNRAGLPRVIYVCKVYTIRHGAILAQLHAVRASPREPHCVMQSSG